MAGKGTLFKCIDNTGVQLVKCIYVYGHINKALPGSLILVSIKKVLSGRKVVKGQVFRAVVVRLADLLVRWTGVLVKYDTNCVVLLKKNELVPLGTRIFGSIFYELRLKGFMKVVFLSSYLI